MHDYINPIMVKVRKDLTGKKFGHLTVLYRAPDRINSNGIRKPQWHCICDCENKTEKDIDQHALFSGNTVSCGCHRKRMSTERCSTMSILNKKKNRYESKGDICICYDESGLHSWRFDSEDYELVSRYYWGSAKGYAQAWDSEKKKNIFMHNIVMNFTPSYDSIIDHIDGDIGNNCKSNLRFVNYAQNSLNHRIRSNNTSGATGVSFDKNKNIWIAYITVNKKRIYIGYFDDKEDAVLARKNAEIKYFGEYRRSS